MLAEILGNAWQLYRKHFVLITAITLIVWGPLEFLSGYMDTFVFDPEDMRRSFKFYQFLDNFFGIIAIGATLALVDASTLGQRVTLGGSFSAGLQAWGRLWWSRFLSMLLIVLGLVALILPGIYLLVRLSQVETLAVCESISGPAAMRRSFELTKGQFWPLFGLGMLFLLVVVLYFGVLLVPALLFPEYENWLVDAGIALVSDVVFAYATVAGYTTYNWLVAKQSSRLNQTSPPQWPPTAVQ
ncbi:hypothetical protein [Verrucomicrobium sp. BvORR106]|uniref:hypothetical protein n=1 Tax=Verrucomicrobium sp. BvORR106 TaxID=1403819 RepID=UPI0005707873|nr:hypothetical protein [Verrucomicrobium sp. BvORR106]